MGILIKTYIEISEPMSRPELIAPPDSYYNDEEAEKYTSRNRIIKIQTEMAERCVQ